MKQYEPFKYATEAGVNMYLGPFRLCQQEDFQYLKDDERLPYYNIYFICQRNRVEVKPETMRPSKNSVFFYFDVYDKNEKFSVPAALEHPLRTKKIKIESEYPHNYFSLVTNKNDRLLTKASHILDEARENILPPPTFLDLEVLYIGQTNRDSEKPIIDRLVNHQTLQKIYSQKTPDKDIHLLLCCFIQDTFIESRGTVRTQKEFEEEDTKRLETFLTNKCELSPEQQINLAEAALIRYFDPEYNKTYKKTFPAASHSKYDECYKLDLNAISIELNTNYYFFSKKVPSSNTHSETYYLTTDEERRKLFDYSVGFDNNGENETDIQ